MKAAANLCELLDCTQGACNIARIFLNVVELNVNNATGAIIFLIDEVLQTRAVASELSFDNAADNGGSGI